MLRYTHTRRRRRRRRRSKRKRRRRRRRSRSRSRRVNVGRVLVLNNPCQVLQRAGGLGPGADTAVAAQLNLSKFEVSSVV